MEFLVCRELTMNSVLSQTKKPTRSSCVKIRLTVLFIIETKWSQPESVSGVHGIVLFCASGSFVQVQNNIMLMIGKTPAHSV